MNYTKEENDFLLINYEKYGARYCADNLKRNIDAIMAKASRMGLKIKNRNIHPNYQKITINNFIKIEKKEVAYFLGYFWADGNIKSYKSNNINHWRIAIEINNDDAENIMDCFMSLGKWSIQRRQRCETWKETCAFVTNNKELYNFLKENDYETKSNSEPTKILEKIPEDLKVYFWRGYFDGDGSVGLSGRGSFIEFASTYNYEYLELKKLFTKLTINNFKIYRSTSKRGHKSSVFKNYGKSNTHISNFLLKSEIGLNRKKLKLQQILGRYEK